MNREAVLLYAIRLGDGTWWRRGYGKRQGGPTTSLRWATHYRNKGAAMTACLHIAGAREVVETPLVIGDVVLRCES